MLLIQSADHSIYAGMLAAGARINTLYCGLHDIRYSAVIGLKRGFFPWHAIFNRIMMLEELLRDGFDDWVFYLDADAFIFDLDFDVREFVRRYDAAMIAAPGGRTGHHWDINSGVFLINLGAADGRAIVRLWYDEFMRTTEDRLRNAPNWGNVPGDQPILQEIFRRNPAFAETALAHAPRMLLNDRGASFVRQILRASGFTVSERTNWIREQVDAQLKRRGQPG